MNPGYLPLLGAAFAWSLSGIFTNMTNQSALLVAGESAGVALLVYCLLIRPAIALSKRNAAAGIALASMSLLFIVANKLTTVGNAIVLQYSSTAFVVLFECLEQHRAPEKRSLLIIFLTLSGILLFFFDQLTLSNMMGNPCAIGSGASFALVFVVNSKPGAAPTTSALVSYCCLLIPGAWGLFQRPDISAWDFAVMIVYGLVCQVMANVCFAKGIVHVPALTANLICMLEVVLTPLWASLAFGESMGRFALLGAALILAGIIIDLKPQGLHRVHRRAHQRCITQ